MGSLLSQDWVPDFDAPVVERLLAAGAVLLGKSNTPEYGWKGETSNRVTGTSHNPWRHGRTPGGSSGGGAAAVAAGLGPLAQGSDGAGSIRIPCCFCGLFGLKPSFGLVPQYPASAVELLSHVGPMTRTVRDAALMLGVMAGSDDRDPHTWSRPRDFLAELQALPARGAAGTRVAWSPDLGSATVDPEVAALTATAARRFADLGYAVEQATPPVGDPWELINVIWGTGEGAVHGDRFGAVREQLDPGLAQVIDDAHEVSGLQLAAALRARLDYYHRMRAFMQRYELLLTPTMPLPAFPAGLDRPQRIGDTALDAGLSWTPFTYPFNVTGQPAATVPCGFTEAGLPVGLQIVGRRRADLAVLAAAAAYEAAHPWADRRPPLEHETR
jgi:aspartyl-tRNA(Asn)/glutamyl-tRNA(Gln) amidotransferase subunit A